ncbi:MAG: outer membrane protein transport protein [Pseudomonadales bacterium]|nr:outer membrane protein transport protein [Pseudomonadales bacterium]
MKWSKLLLLAICVYSPSVFSAVTENISMANAKAAGMAYSVTADPPGVDSIFYNPAGLARIKKPTAQLILLYIAPDFAVDIGEHSAFLSDCLEGISCSENVSNPIFYDEVENTESSTSTLVIMLPRFGATELEVGLVPLGGVAIPIDDNITFGTSVYSTVTAGYQRASDDPGRFFSERLALTRIAYFSPTFAFSVNDVLSVGLGVSLSYFGIAVQMPMRLPNGATGVAGILQDEIGCFDDSDPDFPINLCGGTFGPYTELIDIDIEVEETMSLTYQLGVLWDVTPWLSWGMTYHSGVTDHLKGSAEIAYSDDWQGFFQGLTNAGESGIIDSLIPSGTHEREESDVVLDMNVPSYFSTGISVQLTPSVKVNVDAKMSTWGDTEALTINFKNPNVELMKLVGTLYKVLALETASNDSISLPLYFEDTWSWSIGIEYGYSDNLTLRMGYEDRRASIPNDRQTVLVPLSDMNVYALGFSYRIDALSEFDFALSYYAPEEEHVAAGASQNSNSGSLKDIIYNPYAETDFTTKTSVYKMALSYSYVF